MSTHDCELRGVEVSCAEVAGCMRRTSRRWGQQLDFGQRVSVVCDLVVLVRRGCDFLHAVALNDAVGDISVGQISCKGGHVSKILPE